MDLNKRIVILVLSDIVSALLALSAAFLYRLGRVPSADDIQNFGPMRIVGFVLIVVFFSYLVEIYRNHRELLNEDIAVKIGHSLGVSCVVFSLISYAAEPDPFGGGIVVCAVLVFGILQFLCHAVYRLLVKFRGLARRILILGVGPVASHMGELIPATDENYVLSGYVNCSNETSHVPEATVLENGCGLYETVKRERADKIVVSLSERRGVFPLQEVMACKLDGVEVIDAPSFYEQITGKLFLEAINPSWIIFSDGFKVTALRRIVKRAMDVLLAIIGIVLTLPLLPFIALAIKLDSAGPIFYRQLRVGEKEKTFNLYKFRTMRTDAERETGAVWAKEKDTRVTRVGSFFRKSRIDELPQFFNILRGDMSLVGPRPERPEFVEKLKELIPYYSERHFVKPGVTGWAQVRYPYGASIEDAMEKLRYDLYYIKNISLSFDLMIILETIKVVMFRRGGR